MRRICLILTAVAGLWTLSANQSMAQIGFGVIRQNGLVTGGSLSVGGAVSPGRTQIRMGISAGASQLIGINSFNMRNRRRHQQSASNVRAGQPSVDQFVNASARFDRDNNELLDRKELARIAMAVIAELDRLQNNRNGRSRPRFRKITNPRSSVPEPTINQKVKAFVKRSMEFDADEDDALNTAETKRMALALIRSLS
ncbi:MAG: hypothetical protein MK102_08025 [Fuerstiella sp.]|nr:hypothetical protein [Fuerstiella sp.]